MVKERLTGFEAVNQIYDNRKDAVQEFKNNGQKIMGYYCSYPPLELITAMGYAPYRILGCSHEPITKCDKEIPTIICPFLRSSLDLALKEKFDFLDGFVAAHTCDCEEKLFRIWKDNIALPYYHYIDLPHITGKNAVDQFKKKVLNFQQTLEVHAGRKIDPEKLVEEIRLHNRQRALVRELYDLRKQNPPLITGAETLKTMVALMSLPIEKGNQILKELIIQAGVRRQRPIAKTSRILLWGTPLTETDFIDAIESLDAHVVMDDMCMGTRHYWTDVEITEDPLDGIAKRYLEDIRCPRTIRDNSISCEEDTNDRGYLKDFAMSWNIDGVILQSVKYCDTHGYEIPELKSLFESMGLPSIYIEHQYTISSEAQIKNRVEAFLETIQ